MFKLNVVSEHVRSERAHDFFPKLSWGAELINTTKAEIKPRESKTLARFHLGVHPISPRDSPLVPTTGWGISRSPTRIYIQYTFTGAGTHRSASLPLPDLP